MQHIMARYNHILYQTARIQYEFKQKLFSFSTYLINHKNTEEGATIYAIFLKKDGG